MARGRWMMALGVALMAPAALAAPKVSTFTLENGMRGVVIEDHRAPVVTHTVWYPVGSADEPAGYTGIAHFLEHLMFQGTETIPAGEFSKTVAANGGEDNAFTSSDYTGYIQRIAVDRLGLVMGLEADRMVNLVIEPETVASEREVVLEERNMRVENNPSARFAEQMQAMLYLNHPYGAPVIGWRSEIEALDRAAALDFHERFYAPDNAILVVAGDVTGDEVEALAREHYGPLEPTGARPMERPAEPPHIAARRIEMNDPRVAQPYVQRLYLAPSVVTAEPPRAAALDLLASIMGGGPTSRMTRLLVRDNPRALYAGAYYRGQQRDATAFYVYGAPLPHVAMADLEADIDDLIADIVENGVTQDELDRARNLAIAEEVYAQDSQETLARRYGVALSLGLDVEHVQGWAERLRAVTVEDIHEAARAVFRPERSVTGILTKSTKEQPS